MTSSATPRRANPSITWATPTRFARNRAPKSASSRVWARAKSRHYFFRRRNAEPLGLSKELGRVIQGIRAAFDVATDAEITVECNPTSLDGEHALRLLRDVGVTRLSVGVQALDNAELKYLGRLHDEKGALDVLASVAKIPGLRVSGDLIFGLPEQTSETARSHAMRLSDLGLSHMSCYELTIEPGTRFGELAKRGRLPRADDARVIESFLAIDELLSSRGFRHYEISNYAKPGEEARHNLGYWRGETVRRIGHRGVRILARRDAGLSLSQRAAACEIHAEYSRCPRAVSMTQSRWTRRPCCVSASCLGLRMADGMDVTVGGSGTSAVSFYSKERTA